MNAPIFTSGLVTYLTPAISKLAKIFRLFGIHCTFLLFEKEASKLQ